MFANGEIYFENISPFNLNISNIEFESLLKKSRPDICKKEIWINRILKPGEKFRDTLKNYNYENECLKKVNSINIEMDNSIQSYQINIEDEVFSNMNFLSNNSKKNYKYIDGLSFIKKKGQDYVFDIGSHFIEDPLIVPNGYNLVIQNGTQIYFAKETFIHVVNGDFFSLGTENKVNKFTASKDTWGGILVSNSSRSNIKNTIFEKTDYFNNKISNIYLTGAINFYNSKVNFNRVNFSNSVAEDSLNIINSEFILNNVVFNRSISDALDLDFSKGTISNFKFSEINGDAIDTSGTQVNINNGLINKIDDKAISIGENSEINAEIYSDSLIG